MWFSSIVIISHYAPIWPVPLIDLILMSLNVQYVGLYGGSSTHETYCVENMYATTYVSFLENEKILVHYTPGVHKLFRPEGQIFI